MWATGQHIRTDGLLATLPVEGVGVETILLAWHALGLAHAETVI
jgi:hypothetical protein